MRGGPQRPHGPPNPSVVGPETATKPTNTPWEMPQSQYRNVRPDQPPNFIDDVDIDYNWFTPFQPVWPFGPPYVGYTREWDYPVGVNLEYIPRRLELFAMLRAMSQSWGVLRALIEKRKDQLMSLPWKIGYQGGSKSNTSDKRLEEVKEFFRKPDRKRRFEVWARMILEDLFVIDAPTVNIWKTVSGKPYAAEVIDGATIKPLIDDAGRTPDYPNPAYQQVIKGLPMVNLTERDIIYAPMRPRPQLPVYGYSPVEQIYMEATQGIRRTLFQLDYWQEGTIPEMMITVPDNWTPSQISSFQAYFDGILAGNNRLKSRVRFVPGGMKPFEIRGGSGELLKSDYDEWLVRIACFAFSIPPQPFVKEINRATAETAKEAAQEEGLVPLQVWFKQAIMDPLIQSPFVGFGYDDLEFTFDLRPDTDPAVQSTVLKTYVLAGIMTINEARDQIGLAPVAQGDQLLVAGGENTRTIDQVIDPPTPTPTAAKSDASAATSKTSKSAVARHELQKNAAERELELTLTKWLSSKSRETAENIVRSFESHELIPSPNGETNG